MTQTRLTPAQHDLVAEHYPLAKFLARLVWSKNMDGLDREEVNSVAFEGLITAALRFDPSKNTSFSAYARTRINGAIIDWRRSEDHVRRSVRSDYKRLRIEGYDPEAEVQESLETLAARSEMPVERARLVLDAVSMSPISIDGLIWDDRGDQESDEGMTAGRVTLGEDNNRITSGAPKPVTAEEQVVVGTITSGVVATIRSLSGMQQAIVALRYYQGYELQVISTQLGVSLATVREAHADAVLEIRAAMARSVRH